ncbi:MULTISPECIES: protein TolR [Marinobacter]|jgi:biopolymer transport protein TolR|uniref:Tol-Pal system protein TolR n=3 Tax=Marinobacter TaxID=2742 RepID=A0A350RWD4_MARNT|nr:MULTISPECIES: protein TolR [Marinobacter]MCG8520695.1 protein TolR [Pseudomonadales bacterium]MEC8823397.1 protein TolR [Pseudomonadota bacterium]ABM18785.1 Cell division and transport-associated protein TolR [Marinobacter nauticus VT8]ERS12348.1 biopolymer transporter ExbD [Marinobacter sp. EN3]ERS90274.1 biopolymer transporter ExbD [Marinobacter sp. C1S70]|tara:strand:- start:83 stop:529 length:447 start_codon:yes stop_codon:yes gene_type:complete
MKGMGMMPQQRRKPMSEINVVPYIDVMLVLLVIFMVTAPMLTQGVKVDLPETTSDPIQQDKDVESITVSVDSNGAYYLEVGDDASEPMALDEVRNQVAKILSQRSNGEVLVRGDEYVDYGVVVRLMAELQAAGATGIGLITDAPNDNQ